MSTHSSILVWKIPWTEEPGRLHLWGHTELDMTKQLSTQHKFVIHFYAVIKNNKMLSKEL